MKRPSYKIKKGDKPMHANLLSNLNQEKVIVWTRLKIIYTYFM